MPTQIQLKRGTAASMTALNLTLAAGEPGFETDTRKLKIGDGTTAWNSLPYAAALPTHTHEISDVTNLQTTLNNKQQITTVVALSYAATLNTDASAGDIFDVTLTGNVTLANPSNPVNGKTLRWRIRQDATGSRTVTFPVGTKFVIPSSATSPLPFSTAANAMDILAATYHAGRDKWDIVAMVPGY